MNQILLRGDSQDILIGADGRIERLGPRISAPAAKSVGLNGRIVVPGLVDAHQHLDKTRTLRTIQNPQGDLRGAIDAFRRYAETMTVEDVAARAERTLQACLERGTVAIRTHVNVDAEARTRGVQAMVGVRDRWRDRVRVQVVAFMTSSATKRTAPAREWLQEALDMGADVVGGTPTYAEEPMAFLDMLFDAAELHGKPLDLHLDEHLDAARTQFDAVIERTRAHGMAGRVVASHASALSALDPPSAMKIIEGLASAGIGVVTLPAANLFLQGRQADKLTPRGLTRIKELQDAGVTVAAASDNIQDPFVPPGTGDLLEIARWTLLAGHLGSHDLGRAFEMITAAPAKLLNLENYGVREGARADLLIAEAADPGDLVASGPLARTVLVNGRVVAGTL
jgi:cytosine/creatinine deaminase